MIGNASVPIWKSLDRCQLDSTYLHYYQCEKLAAHHASGWLRPALFRPAACFWKTAYETRSGAAGRTAHPTNLEPPKGLGLGLGSGWVWADVRR